MTKVKVAFGTGGSVRVDACQVCHGSTLERVVFIGYLPPVNQMRPVGQRPAEQPAYPAELLHCTTCGLAQLGLTVDPNILFPPDYPYTSGTTKILRDNFAELARQVAELYPLPAGSLVIDVGSNDGTLLGNFKEAGHRVLGMEPTDAGELARQKGIPTEQVFFGRASAARVRERAGRAKLVTAANVFAHIEDVHEVVEGILDLLDDDGLFVSESHYLLGLIEGLQYDTIYHEHLRYYSLRSLTHLLAMHGLEPVHAVQIPTHGGSIRVYAARVGTRPVSPSVAAILRLEHEAGLEGPALRAFQRRVTTSKLQLHALLAPLKARGARIYGVGAPSRASTLICHAGLDDGIMEAVVEVPGSRKIGKYMPGTIIPVVDEARLFSDPPEFALLLSWHIADELVPKLRARGYKGGFIVPLPEPRVIPAQDP